MLTLKNYQQQTLNTLRDFLKTARYDGPKAAFDAIINKDAGPFVKPYKVIEGLEDVPYLCLRLPTGGGKTLLAAYSINITADVYLEQEYPLVLWLVPTTTIKTQTLETLKNHDHPNRAELDRAFDGRVLVLDITDFEQLRPEDLRSKACIIVGTFATSRVGETELRKVYAHNEELEGHFSKVPPNAPGLEIHNEGDNTGKIKFSFINLLALHHPLVIVDEAHNATSKLSNDVMRRVQPSCIIEFTATPANDSNIIHNVSAAELKTEEMIKLPIILTEHKTWQEALHDSILTRQRLAEFAVKDTDFIRPIVLIQAESKDKEVTVDVIEKYLVEQEKIDRVRIAIATGSQRELDGINLFDPSNKIEFIITVQALKEGWDCSFAYVFCSVATVHSKKDVEQLLGRVLRMPYARKRSHEKLNQAYAHVSSTSWPHAVNLLHDRLVDMGFDELEAASSIHYQPPFEFIKSEAPSAHEEKPLFSFTLSEPPDLSAFTPEEQASVSILTTGEDAITLYVQGEITEALEKKLVHLSPKQEQVAIRKSIEIYRQQYKEYSSPAGRGESFKVPRLCIMVQGELELAEREWFLDARGWNLLDYPAELTPTEFSVQEESESYLIDIKGKKLIEKYLGRNLLLDMNYGNSALSALDLSRRIDKRLFQPDIKQETLLEFIRRTIVYLNEKRNISLTALVRLQFTLEKVLRSKIEEYRERAYKDGYQHTLFGSSTVETSYAHAFSFDPNNYPAHENYKGSFQFSKHFHRLVGELKAEGEEFECAKALDKCPAVKYWVRNLERQPEYSFWLPTSTDLFYPDFVAQLTDGRIFVVEYKGEHLLGSADTMEKQNLGALWEEKSKGQGLFLMATKKDDKGRDVYQQIEDKVKQY